MVIVGERYSCAAKVASDENPAAVTAVIGAHMTGYSNSDVWVFDLYVTYIFDKIPRNIANFFPSIRVMRWSVGNLTAVSAEDLKPFTELTVLTLTAQKIKSLDGNMFQYHPNIQWLVITNNLITNVGKDLITNLKSLQVFYFTKNTCMDMTASTPETFAEMKRLLPIQCPPLHDECPRCSTDEDVEKLKKQAEEQNKKIAQLLDENVSLKENLAELVAENQQQLTEIDRLHVMIEIGEETIRELEKQLRESNTCT